MIGDWKNSGLCLEDGIKPATDNLINLQSIYSNCLEGDDIIDEDATFEQFGYRSNELSYGSGKSVVAVCDKCGKIRDVRYQDYRALCYPCSTLRGEDHPNYGKYGKDSSNYGSRRSDETKRKISEAKRGIPRSEETICKMSEYMTGRYTGEDNPNYGNKWSDETRQRASAAKQGIPYDEWDGFTKNGVYCEKFDEACRERIRDKYNRECFICGKHESENVTKSGKLKKLSVHHVDMNKDQGCNGNEWVLIPACIAHHSPLHTSLWTSRIKYLLANEAA